MGLKTFNPIYFLIISVVVSRVPMASRASATGTLEIFIFMLLV